MSVMLGVYNDPGALASVVKRLRGRGYNDLETYSPAPFPEIDDAVDPRPSRVRIFTLLGALAGVTFGFWMQIWMSLDWPIKIAGKPSPRSRPTGSSGSSSRSCSAVS